MYQDALVEMAAYGGNTVRVWLHNDGSSNPTFTAFKNATHPGLVDGVGQEALDDLKWLLALCDELNMKVLLTLWSHDLLAVRK